LRVVGTVYLGVGVILAFGLVNDAEVVRPIPIAACRRGVANEKLRDTPVRPPRLRMSDGTPYLPQFTENAGDRTS
jgi:hypothetical protein